MARRRQRVENDDVREERAGAVLQERARMHGEAAARKGMNVAPDVVREDLGVHGHESEKS